jgi:hypothetical protein
MKRLQKFIEKGGYGEGALRTAYALDVDTLPEPAEGKQWHLVDAFSAADEVLADPALKEIFKLAIEKGCAVVTPKAKGSK